MNWYYVEAGKQAGPVDDLQLHELRRSGRLQNDTLVWREGMANWQPYSEVHPAGPPPLAESTTTAPPPSAPPVPDPSIPGGVLCSVCGKTFPPSEVIRYEDKSICAACKPGFFQRLREGAPLATAAPGAASEADLLARDYDVDIGACFSRGWEVFKANAGLMIGASVLVYLALIVINAIPYLNLVLAIIFTGPLMGGLWYFYIRKMRNENAEIGDAFSGFSPRFWQLVLTQLIPTLIMIGFVFFFGIMAALTIPAMAGMRRGGTHVSGAIVLPLVIVFLAFIGVVLYLNVCWFYALPLASDKRLKFWPALELSRRVVRKHWWKNFWLIFVCGIFGMIGVIACVVGVLVTGPVALSSLTCHYQKVFGDLAPNA